MTAAIKLSNGELAIVDKRDVKKLSELRWHKNSSGYAIHTYQKNGKYGSFLMHRIINNTPDGYFTDHINRNKLDNRKINLRTVTHGENIRNTKGRGNSGIKGVYKTINGDYRVMVCVGTYDTAEKAHEMYVLALSKCADLSTPDLMRAVEELKK